MGAPLESSWNWLFGAPIPLLLVYKYEGIYLLVVGGLKPMRSCRSFGCCAAGAALGFGAPLRQYVVELLHILALELQPCGCPAQHVEGHRTAAGTKVDYLRNCGLEVTFLRDQRGAVQIHLGT